MEKLKTETGTEKMIQIMREFKERPEADFVDVEEADFWEFRPNLAGERTIKVCALKDRPLYAALPA